MGTGAASAIVVVVDDDPSWRNVMALALRRAGHRVHVLADPRQAVDVVVELEPALVTLDFDMPHRTGMDVAEELHARLGTSCPPLLVISGSLSAVEGHRSRDLLCHAMPKMASLHDILAEVRRALAGRTRSGTLAAVRETPEGEAGSRTG